MISQQMMRAFGIAVPVVSAATFLGILAMFNSMTASTNLFNTGVTIGFILAIANVLLAIAIYKNRI